jgi:alpha-N-arabinofuranosidase
MQDALGIAAGLHEMFRNSDLFYMANYAQTVNVIGCIKTTKTKAGFAATAMPLMLYRKYFGVIPVEVSGVPEPLDVVAAWTENREAITIAVVNPTEKKYELKLDVKNTSLGNDGDVWCVQNSNPMAYNTPGQEPQVTIEEKAVSEITNKLSVPALSISLYRLSVR